MFLETYKKLGNYVYYTFMLFFVKYTSFGFLGYLSTKNLHGSYIYENAFSLLYLSYTVGLFLAKLSLEFVKFNNIGVFGAIVFFLMILQIGFIIMGLFNPLF